MSLWCVPAGFLDRLRIELRLQGQLQSLGLKPGLVQQLLKTRATSNAEVNELRLDLSPMKQVELNHVMCDYMLQEG